MERRSLLSVKERKPRTSLRSTGLVGRSRGRRSTTPVMTNYTPSLSTMTSPSLSIKPVAPISPGEDEFMTNSNIEEALARSGYIPKTRVISKNEDGSIETNYIKTINKRGQIAYVELDEPGHVTTDKDDMIMAKTKSASSIPYSTKAGLYDCLDMDVCGAAFECEGEVCIVSRKSGELSPTETVLTTTEKTAQKTALEHSSPVAYPVVRMSEVIRDPDMVDEAVSGATNTIRSNAYMVCVETMEETEKEASDLLENVRVLRSIYADKFDKLSSTTRHLESMRQEYGGSPEDGRENKKYHSILYNLSKRNEMQEQLFQLCHMVSDYRDALMEINERLSRGGEYVVEHYKGLEYVFDRDF